MSLAPQAIGRAERDDFEQITRALKVEYDLEIVDTALAAWANRDTSSSYSLLVESIDRHFNLYSRRLEVAVDTGPIEVVAISRDSPARLRALSLTYRIWWVGLAILAMVWGYLTAASFLAGVGIQQGTAIFGVLAILGLISTLAVAGRGTKKRLTR